MFNWFGNRYPYSDIHSLNLDWILEKMKETAGQAAKAVADAANALAQVAEAKAAALTAQTAAQDAQTAANKAAGNAASAAANAVQALNAAQTAEETATAANNKAQTAQETATAANNKALTAQETATAANSTANTIAGKFPIRDDDIANGGILKTKFAFPHTSIKRWASLHIPSNSISDVFNITYTDLNVSAFFDTLAMGSSTFSIEYSIYDKGQSSTKEIVLNPIFLRRSLISPAFYYDPDTQTIIQGTLYMSRSGDTVSLKLNFPQRPDLSSITDPAFAVDFYFVYTDISTSAGI